MNSAASGRTLDPSAMRRHAASAAKLIGALSNRHRLLILCALSEGEFSVGDLNRLVRLSQSALSQHLAVLRRERLVSTRRSAQTIYYMVAPGVAMDVVNLLHDHYCGVRPAVREKPAVVRSPASTGNARKG
jgi:ArsR family transcriptional regulator, virulence genes transcriptional regulator